MEKLKVLEEVLNPKKVIVIETDNNESNEIIYCNIDNKGYRIHVTREEKYDDAVILKTERVTSIINEIGETENYFIEAIPLKNEFLFVIRSKIDGTVLYNELIFNPFSKWIIDLDLLKDPKLVIFNEVIEHLNKIWG